MTIKQFIEKAIEGGWKSNFLEGQAIQKIGDTYAPALIHPIVLDPEAWKAVGKVEGWNTPYYQRGSEECAFEMSSWLAKQHRMIDALAEGKTIEQYLETL